MLDKMALHAALPAIDTSLCKIWIRQTNYSGQPSERLQRDHGVPFQTTDFPQLWSLTAAAAAAVSSSNRTATVQLRPTTMAVTVKQQQQHQQQQHPAATAKHPLRVNKVARPQQSSSVLEDLVLSTINR
jgi:hypothetical protein